MRYCICADPENCKETIPGYVCRKGMAPSLPAVEAQFIPCEIHQQLNCEAVVLADYEQGIPKALRQELFACASQNGRISYEYLCRLYMRGVMKAIEVER